MKFNIHAGHNPDGKVASGAVGLISESTEARKVKDLLIAQLEHHGHNVLDCTVDNGTSQNDVLTKIIAKCNSNTVDLDVSIHFNAGASDVLGNGQTTGVEVLVYDNSTVAHIYAERICEKITALGFRNRGVKQRKDLYFLNATKSPAVLIECCFVDDKDDVKLYDASMMAKAIGDALGGCSKMTEKRYNTIDELPDWAVPIIAEMVEQGQIADGNNLDLSHDMLRTIIMLKR